MKDTAYFRDLISRNYGLTTRCKLLAKMAIVHPELVAERRAHTHISKAILPQHPLRLGIDRFYRHEPDLRAPKINRAKHGGFGALHIQAEKVYFADAVRVEKARKWPHLKRVCARL